MDKAVPIWNECLSWYHSRHRVTWDIELGNDCYKESPAYPGFSKGDSAEEQEQGYDSQEEKEEGDDDEEDEDDDELEWERKEHFDEWLASHPEERVLIHPTADTFVSFEERATAAGAHRINLPSKYPDGLQVIFKLASIHLTPEKPKYNGSSWHVEGCLNEHIAATALFYYDSQNVKDNYLEFRQHVDAQDMVMQPAQHEYTAAEDVYGIKNGAGAVQDLGKVLTRPGRFLAFPNVLQHRVGEFELADPTKPGHRKILAMFLIDPNIRILSTANVPPQRRDWWAKEVRKVKKFAALPQELFDRIVESVNDFSISWDAACDTRELLMEERGRFAETYDEMLNDVSVAGFSIGDMIADIRLGHLLLL